MKYQKTLYIGFSMFKNPHYYKSIYRMKKKQQQNFILVIILLILIPYAQSIISKKHKNITNTITSNSEQAIIPNIVTSCNILNLATTYNYGGIVAGGYLSVPGKGNSALAYTFYGKKDLTDVSQLKNYPTVLWLGGGPGKSSQSGNLQEIGPLLLIRDFDAKIVQNNYTWANNYNLLFIDQPVGTGLSYIDNSNRYAKTLDEIANDLYESLRELYNGRGCFNMEFGIPPSNPLVIFGEDFGGKYAAAIAKKIVEAKQLGGFLTGLKGVAIGSGIVQPYEILTQVGTYAFNLGLIDYQQREKIQKLLLVATRLSMDSNWQELLTTYNSIYSYLQDRSAVNKNDIKLDDPYEDLLRPYFQNQTVASAIYGFNTEVKYDINSANVYNNLKGIFMKPEANRVEYLLSKGIPVLLYNGQDNLIVPSLGAMKWVDNLNHNSAQEFNKQMFGVWKIGDKIVGAIKSAGNLEMRIIFNAGHIIGKDKPLQHYDMAVSFINRITK